MFHVREIILRHRVKVDGESRWLFRGGRRGILRSEAQNDMQLRMTGGLQGRKEEAFFAGSETSRAQNCPARRKCSTWNILNDSDPLQGRTQPGYKSMSELHASRLFHVKQN